MPENGAYAATYDDQQLKLKQLELKLSWRRKSANRAVTR